MVIWLWNVPIAGRPSVGGSSTIVHPNGNALNFHKVWLQGPTCKGFARVISSGASFLLRHARGALRGEFSSSIACCRSFSPWC